MTAIAITCVVIFSFAIGVICGRIWKRYAERPVTGMAYGNRSPAEMQMGARGIPNARVSTQTGVQNEMQADAGMSSMSGSQAYQGEEAALKAVRPRPQVYPQGQQYRMGDWDKGPQE